MILHSYFAHFLSDDGLPAQRKQVVFALDASESMYGHKAEQIKATVIDALRKLEDGVRPFILSCYFYISASRSITYN